MAKELPYFKFEPNAWENGNIQMLSREDKGLFIDICSMYWSRLGDLPLKLVIQKLCAGNATALSSLCEDGIMEVIDDNIYIKFLTIQLSEFENTSKKNSNNAKLRWEKHRKQKDESDRNATALNSQCETDAIREEKRREDERKEINISVSPPAKSFKQFSKTDLSESLKPFLSQYDKTLIREFYDYWIEPLASGKMRMTGEKAWDVSRRLKTWKSNNSKYSVPESTTPKRKKL